MWELTSGQSPPPSIGRSPVLNKFRRSEAEPKFLRAKAATRRKSSSGTGLRLLHAYHQPTRLMIWRLRRIF